MTDTIIRSIRNDTPYPFKLGFDNIILEPGVIVDLFERVSDDTLILLQKELKGLEKRKSITVIRRESEDTLTLANDRQARADILALSGEVIYLEGSIITNRSDIEINKSDISLSKTDIVALTSLSSDSNGLIAINISDIEINKSDIDVNKTDILSLDTQISDLLISKALKKDLVITEDLTISAIADASVQSASYVQIDVQSIADLVNDLKAKVNTATTLVNELKAKVNEMNNL